MIERIDQLSGPAVVGRLYLVPTVMGEWDGAVRDWPVIGPKHHDAQCLNFHDHHYHLDARFLPTRMLRDLHYWRFAFAAPLSTNVKINPSGLPAPVFQRRKCRRLQNPFFDDIVGLAGRHPNWQCHFDQWTGKQAKHDGRGWVCPHRNVALAGHAPAGGVVTCPLHLLRIDTVTGVVLPPVGKAVPA